MIDSSTTTTCPSRYLLVLLLLLLLQPHDIFWYAWRGPFACNFNPIRKEFYSTIAGDVHIAILGSCTIETTKAYETMD
jgi:hypothetical protein